MSEKKYLENPTEHSALSYWKSKKFKVPDNMKIINDKYFSKELLKDFNDDIYFKLVHNLNNIILCNLPENFIFYKCSIEEFAIHINSCYDEGITIKELESYKDRIVYDEELWICIFDKYNKKIVATGIAEFDDEIKEGYLDWIQVSKDYRKKDLEQLL